MYERQKIKQDMMCYSVSFAGALYADFITFGQSQAGYSPDVRVGVLGLRLLALA